MAQFSSKRCAVPVLIFINLAFLSYNVLFRQGELSAMFLRREKTMEAGHWGNTASLTADSTSTGSEQTSRSLSKEEQIAAFYKHHYEQMSALVNESSVMRWHYAGTFNTFIREFQYVTIEDETTNLEESNLQNHSFVFAEEASLCTVAKVFNKFHQSSNVSWPHVALVRFNNDFGALSSPVPGQTANINIGPHYWEREGCRMEFVLEYINHPDTLAIFTSQFQVFQHEKVISIPLGLPRTDHYQRLRIIRGYNPSKTKRSELLMLNVKPWGQRVGPMKQILQNFNATKSTIEASISENELESLTMKQVTEMITPQNSTPTTLRNTYQLFQSLGGGRAMSLYYNQMMRSRFVWSPTGLALDCYRHWEAMYLGAIPVIAHLGRMEVDGWMSDTMRELPIAWVEQYDQITPEFLEQAFDRIVLEPPPGGYRYEKLTKQYWIDKAYSFLPPNSPGLDQKQQ